MAALTYDQLVARIASLLGRDDLDPSPRDGSLVIRDMCVDRVNYYKNECFYSGQVVDDSITTAPGTAYYNFPDGWEEVDSIDYLQGGNWLSLTRSTMAEIDSMDVNQPPLRGVPSHWAPLNNQFRVFLVPDVAYQVQITMNIPPDLPAAGASNFWTGDAMSLIINGVCAELADSYIHDPLKADRFRPLEQRELLRMQAKTMRIRGGIQIQPYL